MASRSSSPAHPAWVRVTLCAALVLACALVAAPNARAQADPRFDVLVFSRTVPAQSPHEAAIDAGHAAIAQFGEAGNFEVTSTEDATVFTDGGLRPYEVVVFLNTDGNGVLNADQRNAFERWLQRGNGLVAIHSATNADRDWDWWGDMNGGAWFLNHPSGAVQFQNADVHVEDGDHPATAHLDPIWVREDEWYSFTANPRGDVHVLMTIDEDSYDLTGATPMGDDHPIAWCSNYDRGRHFYTALGHHGTYWSEPDYRQHIVGAIEWAAGEAEGDCGPEREGLPTDASFDKVTLDDNTENPMELAVAPDGRVFYIELAGRVKLYDPADNSVRVVGNIPVHRGNENGLLGIALDPDFETNNRLYLFYSAPPQQGPTGFQHVSRFTVGENGSLNMGTEVVLLRIFHQRLICCHSAGSLTFGPGGELYISTGDDTTPFETNSFAPIDDDVLRANVPGDPENDANRAYDARRTSGNTNDLRGKILRIVPIAGATPEDEPGLGSTYEVPEGNLFAPGTANTRPEIYTMGHRNPFRISVDQETGWLYNGEVGPDANNDSDIRGPRGYDEINQIREAGNMGWPYCIAGNWRTADPDDSFAYRDWTYPSGPAGAAFDCSGAAGGGPVNTSNYNTGLTQLPPAKPALLYWPYTPYQSDFPFPEIPGGNGRTAIAGPVYHFDPDNPADTKFPAYYDDKLFFADWSRNWIATLELDEEGMPADIEEFMPNNFFRSPHDMEMGPDGSLYLIEWGVDFNFAGQGINPDSGLYRIDFVKGARSPVARATADRESGPAPLEVTFSSEGSEDPDGDEITYEWNFGDGTPVSNDPNPTHVFEEPGQYNVRLTVTDTTGKTGTSSVVITAGNTQPTVELEIPEQGGIYGWGDAIAFRVNVTDPEDGEIDCQDVEIVPGIFHDEGGNAHVHEGVRQNGCEGSFETPPESGHEKNAVIALVVTAVYEDKGGSGGAAPPLIGADTHRLNPNQIQAEHFTDQSGVTVIDAVGAEGGRRTSSSNAGDWIYFDPVSLKGIDELTIRYTAGGAGGLVELRLDAPDGPLVGTADLVTTGGNNIAGEVTTAIDAPDDGPHRLYLVYVQRSGGPANNMFQLDELTFVGRGVAGDAAPSAAIEVDRDSGSVPLTVNFTGIGEDPEGTDVSFEWDFESDGTVDATTAEATHVYTVSGVYTATLTVKDAGGRSRTATVRIEAFEPIGDCPGDDDFIGDALNRDMWSVVREVPADLTVGGGNLTIQSRPGDIFANSEDGGQGPMQNIVLQDLPDSGPWTATTRMTWNPTGNFQNAGLKIYDSDDNWIKFGMVWNAGRKFEFYKELNDGPTNLFTTGNLPTDFPSTFQLRLISDGTSIVAQYSPDGQEWTPMGSAQTNLSGFANPRIGMYATSTNQPSIPAVFDWFTLDFPGDASDEFDGDSLDLCRWTEIVRHDPEGYEVTGGELVMPAAHGDFFGDGPNDNPNIILQPAPAAGEWSATTRVRFMPNENFEQAGLIVYGDDANYAKADLVSAGGSRVMEFLRETNNSPTGFGGSVTLPSSFPDTVEIRIVSDGENLNAFYRPVGGEWAPFGDVDQTSLAAIPNPKIGVYANDGNQTVATREQAAFDFFRVTLGEPDEEPPVTVHSLDPAAPDGESGWYVSPVQVTLSTEAGATTEHRIGDGSFQAYEGPFSISADGVHEVTYRSTDAAGNVEGDKSFTVRIDRTAPDVACSALPGVLWPPDETFKPVAVGLDVDDAVSGPGSFRLDSVTSSEPASDFARGWRIGAADTLGELRAIRNENPTRGRTYTLAYTVFDRAGNGTECAATVSVPRTPGSAGAGSTALTALAPSPEGGTAATADSTSSWFKFGKTTLRGKRLRVVLRLPAEGKLRVRAVVRPKGGKAIKLRTRRLSGEAGRTRLTLKLPEAARRAAARAGRARVTVRVAYRPEGAKEWRKRKLALRLVASR